MRKILTLLLGIALLVTSITGCSPKSQNPVEGKKIAYIMYMSSSAIFDMWSESFTETAEALGMEADTFFCEDSDEAWKKRILQCAEEGYDGLLVSHGGVDYAWEFLVDVLEEYPDLKIATFDTSFQDANGETQKIDGVVQLFQRDSGLAAMLVEEILAMYPKKCKMVNRSISYKSKKRTILSLLIVVRWVISFMKLWGRSKL